MIEENITDAINGGQLYSLGNAISTIFGGDWLTLSENVYSADTNRSILTIGDTTYTDFSSAFTAIGTTLDDLLRGWNLAVDNSGSTGGGGGTGGTGGNTGSTNPTNIQPGDTVTIAEGSRGNIEINLDEFTKTLTIDVSDNPTFESVTVTGTDGTVEIKDTGITVANANVDQVAGIDNTGRVWGKTGEFTGTVTVGEGDNMVTIDGTDGSIDADKITVADETVNIDDSGITISDSTYSTSISQTTEGLYIGDSSSSITLAETVTVSSSGITLIGTGSNYTISWDENGFDFNSAVLTGVANGSITSTSTDAINGGQLWSLGNSIASAFGSGWSFDNGVLTGSFTLNGVEYFSISDALEYLADGWYLAVDSGSAGGGGGTGGTGGNTGSTSSNIQPGDTVTFVNSDNVIVSVDDTNDGATVTIDLADNVSINNSLTVAETVTIDSTGISVKNGNCDNDPVATVGNNGNIWASTAISVGEKDDYGNGVAGMDSSGNIWGTTGSFSESLTVAEVVKIGSTGIDMGGTSISSVESITFSNAYTISGTIDGFSFGGARLTGLADGGIYQGSTDAVTGNQLWQAYQRMGELREAINIVGAHAAALSGLHPIQYDPYQPTTFTAAMGTYRDEVALALGIFHYVQEEVMFNVGASLTSGGDLMGRMGVSIKLGKKPDTPRPQSMNEVQMQLAEVQKALLEMKGENKALKARLNMK